MSRVINVYVEPDIWEGVFSDWSDEWVALEGVPFWDESVEVARLTEELRKRAADTPELP